MINPSNPLNGTVYRRPLVEAVAPLSEVGVE